MALNFYIVIYREMIKKIFFSRTTALNKIMFCMEHPQDKEIQVCLNKVPGVIYGPALWG